MTSSLFASPGEISADAEVKVFGTRYRDRYHLPLLSGEKGVRAGTSREGDWVPYGVQSTTNLVGAWVDTRALATWEEALALVGLVLSPDLHEELVLVVQQALAEGKSYDDKGLRAVLAGFPGKAGRSIVGRALEVAKANAARNRGTNRHTAWEHRGVTGELIGTAAIQDSTQEAERLLAEAGLERVPGLCERVVRNVAVNAAGRFDDILLEQSTGRLLMSDLKTKRGDFYSYAEVDAQLAVYARAEWMLAVDGQSYEPGPREQVDQHEGVILHVPSDGGQARLERADLDEGWENALLARQVCDRRSAGKSADRKSRSTWKVAS